MDEAISLNEFYKEQYFKELDRKNELTNSLSFSIGIITALVAMLSYVLSNFSFSADSILLSIITALAVLGASLFLCISIYHLIKALSNFHNGYDYAYLANIQLLDEYHKALITYYQGKSEGVEKADEDYTAYLLREFVHATSINQNNNKTKTAHRFLCHKYMVFSFIALCAVAIPVSLVASLSTKTPEVINVRLK